MTRVGTYRAQIGESPVWHALERCLYHVDISGRRIVRTELHNGDQTVTDLPDEPGAVAALGRAGVLVTLPGALLAVSPDGQLDQIERLDFLPADQRFNDGTVDQAGRVLVSSCARSSSKPPVGALWSLAPGRPPLRLLGGLRIPNGMALSPDNRQFYLSDSAPDVQTIWRCSYDLATGAIGDRQLLCDMHGLQGRPDGAAIDGNGGYWIAATEGRAVLRIGAGGNVAETIPVPTYRPSKPVFAGRYLDRLLVTSIGQNVPPDDTLAGHLIEIDCPVLGQPVPACAHGAV